MPLIAAEHHGRTAVAPRARARSARAPAVTMAVLLHAVCIAGMAKELNKAPHMIGLSDDMLGVELSLGPTIPRTAPPSAAIPADLLQSVAALSTPSLNPLASTPLDGRAVFQALDGGRGVGPPAPGETAAPAGGSPAPAKPGTPTSDPWAHASFVREQPALEDPELNTRLARCSALSAVRSSLRVLISLDGRGGVSDVRRKDGAPLQDGAGFAATTVKQAIRACGPYPSANGAPRTLMATIGQDRPA